MEFEVVLDETLHKLGLHCLKVKQLEAVQAFITGKYTFVVLPTGYGKPLFMLSCQICMIKFEVTFIYDDRYVS